MHVAADLNWFLQGIVVTVAAALGLVILVRKAASRYFVVDSSFGSSVADFSSMNCRKGDSIAEVSDDAARGSVSCAVCGLLSNKQCARCKMVKYCSEACQKSHWNSEHKNKCLNQSLNKANQKNSNSILAAKRASIDSSVKAPKVPKPSNKILFPYEDFVEFFNWDKLDHPPCGLLNCGNSCFANVVLQCLAHTRSLVAYLLVKGHRKECQRDDWCFLCEFQTHVERSGQSLHPFSPMNILSRLPNIGGNLGYGKQEDAHEFMRFAIDTMQSVCLDDFGGEKVVPSKYQETTLIQHIFGGRLQSQVICSQCNNVSNQFENMMDLTVEIHGDAGSLEECLDQFTAKERLHGDNMYKCDGCNDYVMAWKRLTVQQAPNILTIALKRFQSGRFGKLNKRVTFPETLDLRRYMSELEDGNDVYRLYAVIVHVDMLNASFFGHYICYIKDFHGNWYRIDDCKVCTVELDEVLSQGAYMLLYSRVSARPSCLLTTDTLMEIVSETEGTKISELQPSMNECLLDCEPEFHEHPSFESSSESSVHSTGESIASNPEKTTVDKKLVFDDSGSPTSLMNIDDIDQCSPKEPVSPLNPTLTDQISRSTVTSLIDETTKPFEFQNPESSPFTSECSETYSSERCSPVSHKVPDDVNNVNAPSSPSSVTENMVKQKGSSSKLTGGSSSPKFKPLLQPGFLGKAPTQRRSAIRT